ncbi:amidinotransferase [Leifsonia sp. ALI-44-B]|nr:amidinotransferase [Leifsonia sp. ALI-44-B]
MIRPHHFTPNPLTAADNVFQVTGGVPEAAEPLVASTAHDEVTRAAGILEAAGVRVHLFDDPRPDRPDSVFPNNWLSTHAGGHVGLFPMYAPNRRGERRGDVIEMLKRDYRVQNVIDYSGLEYDDTFLEGTGAMVLDHAARVAYVARSHRADPIALERFCADFGYEPMVFDAADPEAVPIYHTNVMMCIATDFALIGLDLITSAARRAEVSERIASHGRDVIALDFGQVRDFAGNAMELRTASGERILALSSRAHRSLRPDQLAVIERSCRVVALDVPTIELAGGSVRCMLAGIHLDARPARPAVKQAQAFDASPLARREPVPTLGV